jgi:hypothetical protein
MPLEVRSGFTCGYPLTVRDRRPGTTQRSGRRRIPLHGARKVPHPSRSKPANGGAAGSRRLAGCSSSHCWLSTWVGLFAFMGPTPPTARSRTSRTSTSPWSRWSSTFPDLSQGERVYAAGGELLAELHDGRNSEPVRYDQIPEVMIHAVLAAEDRSSSNTRASTSRRSPRPRSTTSSTTPPGADRPSPSRWSRRTSSATRSASDARSRGVRLRRAGAALLQGPDPRVLPELGVLRGGAYGVKTAAEEFFAKPLSDIRSSRPPPSRF